MGKVIKASVASFIIAALTITALYMFIHRMEFDVFGIKISIDTLSLPFIINAGLIGIACLVASTRYIELYELKGVRIPYYSLVGLFVVTMMLIPMVRNWIVFIFLWEVMTLISYFLITYDYKDEEILKVGRNYFITMHVFSTTPLLLLFMLIRHATNTYSFDHIQHELFEFILILALIGFGTKAGLFPFHFWLPQAHPAAPSPVSALLSGSMVKLGIYGIARVLSLSVISIPEWFVWTTVTLSVLSIMLAFLMYPIQKDVKRLFAWSTIDNIGWMTFIVVSYMIGLEEAEILLGLYVLSHGVAKASVFILSGGLIYSYGTKKLEEIKGLVHTNKSLVYLLILAIFALEGVPPFSLFLSKHDVVLKTLAYNFWLGLFLLISWCLVFIIFLTIIHDYFLAEGAPKPIRPLPKSIFYSTLFLVILSIISYPLLLVILGGIL